MAGSSSLASRKNRPRQSWYRADWLMSPDTVLPQPGHDVQRLLHGLISADDGIGVHGVLKCVPSDTDGAPDGVGADVPGQPGGYMNQSGDPQNEPDELAAPLAHIAGFVNQVLLQPVADTFHQFNSFGQKTQRDVRLRRQVQQTANQFTVIFLHVLRNRRRLEGSGALPLAGCSHIGSGPESRARRACRSA